MQEQENQKRHLCDELEQLKTPQDSREASCQTPAPEDEVREQGTMSSHSNLMTNMRVFIINAAYWSVCLESSDGAYCIQTDGVSAGGELSRVGG